ncbi:MAG: aldehyde ferredoxin oxidoreductase family protein [Dehalococcoidales bacterium]|nr:aldehyde ferredoxin oxidoreductase family protein [Dehalococcoidales bacterium]
MAVVEHEIGQLKSMRNGYLGKLLVVDLSSGDIAAEPLPEDLLGDFIGGYGVAARLLLERMHPGTDPLGPDNYLGFFTGPLTGTAAPFGNRYMVAGKSPLTMAWGDANAGGEFGPYLKFAGYDAVLFRGIAAKPTYLLIDAGVPSLRDASHLWEKDTYETELALRSEYGDRSRVACIGPSAEKLSLISCVISDYGRAAGRSGLGAVMGSKRLKAIVVRGKPGLEVAEPERTLELTRKYIATLTAAADGFRRYGTCGGTAHSIMVGDAPVKNWGGTARDFPDGAAIGGPAVIAREARKYGCWRCPIRCGGIMKANGQEYQWEAGVHKPEYETLAAFGSMCLNRNLPSIIKCNDICNRYGLDTISAGATVAFAIECYENGIISRSETEGLELNWGNHKALVDLTLKMARREGFGDVLADGVKRAAERIGRGSEQFAMHIQGQEVPMHDPKRWSGFGTLYRTDATPGRHTQGHEGWVAPGLPMPPFNRNALAGRGAAHKTARLMMHSINAAGVCMFGYNCMNARALPDLLSAVTGLQYDFKALLTAGERIACARQLFDVREGINPIDLVVPGRVTGRLDLDIGAREFYQAMGWDLKMGKPSTERLRELGLVEFA